MGDEFSLLEAWRAGDRSSGNVLFERYFEPVSRFFVNKVQGDVEDLVQRTFLACVEAQRRFEGRSTFKTFVLAIANNILREHYRKHARSSVVELDDDAFFETRTGAATALERNDRQKRLLAALRRLPLDSQVVLELVYWEKLTGPELGETLDVPENTARSRLRRAKQQLRDQLEAMTQE